MFLNIIIYIVETAHCGVFTSKELKMNINITLINILWREFIKQPQYLISIN